MSLLVKEETKAVPEASLPAVTDLSPSDETGHAPAPEGCVKKQLLNYFLQHRGLEEP